MRGSDMTDPAQPVGAPPPADPASSTSTDPAKPAAPGTAAASAAIGSIASMEDLKVKAKPLYDAVMMAIATTIKNQQDASNDRIKEILAEEKNQR